MRMWHHSQTMSDPAPVIALHCSGAGAGQWHQLGLCMPALIMRGEHAPAPSRLIAETLPTLMPAAHLAVIAGAGHMGPLTHASEVNEAIAQHIAESEAKSRQRCLPTSAPPLHRFSARFGMEVKLAQAAANALPPRALARQPR